MNRDRDLPALDIELQPAPPSVGARDRHASPPKPTGRFPRRRLTIAGAALLAVSLLATVRLLDEGSKSQRPPLVPDATPASTNVTVTLRTPTPGILGTTNTKLLLWTFDSDSRLQVLDLDSGQLRPLGPRGGFAVFPLLRQVVIVDEGKSRVVSATGETLAEILGFGLPVVVGDNAQLLWTLSDAFPRRWQERFVDGNLADEIATDANVSLLPYRDRTVLLVSATGTSRFDLVTRQQRPITPTPVVAAEFFTLIGRTCQAERCTISVIDPDTGGERVLISDLSSNDAGNINLAPNGGYLAITRKAPESGRYAQIIDIATGRTLWQSPAGISFAGPGPAWSWTPNSTWLFVTMSAQQVVAVNVSADAVTQIEIPLPLTPLHGIAVTNR